MYRWLLYGHLLGVGLVTLGTGTFWLATEALLKATGPVPALLHLVERGMRVVVGGASYWLALVSRSLLNTAC